MGEVDSQLTADSTQSILSAVLLSLSVRTHLFPSRDVGNSKDPSSKASIKQGTPAEEGTTSIATKASKSRICVEKL